MRADGSPAPRTAVVVVNFNGAADTELCVKSLAALDDALDERPFLIVVDNASDDGGEGLEAILSLYPGAEFIRSPMNVGFGRGNNLGISWAMENTGCEFVLLLNNDATVEPGAIKTLEAALDGRPGAGVAAPRILLLEEPETLWYGGGEINWAKGGASDPGYLGPAETERSLSARDVSFASGCAMLIRREVLEGVGGFDPRFFMYEEDLELCLRIRERGWGIWYEPTSIVLHKGHGSQREGEGDSYVAPWSPKNPHLYFHMRHVTKNRLLNMAIHARGGRLLRFLCVFPAVWGAKCAQFALHGRWDGVRAVARGVGEFAVEVRKPFKNELGGR